MAERINGSAATSETVNGKQAGDGKLAFLLEFIRHPRQIGSVIPSSRFLERRVLDAAGVASARTVVELGPGTGGTTRSILARMPSDSRLLSIEINPLLHGMVSEIEDRRLIAHLGSACDLEDILAQHDLPAPDAVISGIPFSTLDRELGAALVGATSGALAPGGCFVAYQARDTVARLADRVMDRTHTVTEFRNIPPMRVYRWIPEARTEP